MLKKMFTISLLATSLLANNFAQASNGFCELIKDKEAELIQKQTELQNTEVALTELQDALSSAKKDKNTSIRVGMPILIASSLGIIVSTIGFFSRSSNIPYSPPLFMSSNLVAIGTMIWINIEEADYERVSEEVIATAESLKQLKGLIAQKQNEILQLKAENSCDLN